MADLRDVMTKDVHLVRADASVGDAIEQLAEHSADALPVWDGTHVVGMVGGDLDGKSGTVADVMTPQVVYVFDDDDIDRAYTVMKERGLSVLAVFNHDNQLVGMLTPPAPEDADEGESDSDDS